MGNVKAYMDLICKDGYQRIMEYGDLTRIDLTVDINNAYIDNLLFYYPGISCSERYDKSGKLETLYLGKKACKKRWCIYDKIAEIKRKNIDKTIYCLHHKEKVPDHPITRIEYRINPKKKGIHLDDLTTMKNPFKALKLAVYKFPELSKYDYIWHLFFDSCRHRGLQQALLILPKDIRKKFKDKLNEKKLLKKLFWWKPDATWDQLPSLIEKFKNPGKPDKHVMNGLWHF